MWKWNKRKNVEIEKLKIIEAEAEACVLIVTKEEHDEEIEWDKHKKSIKMLTFKCTGVERSEHEKRWNSQIKQPTKIFGHVKPW